MAHPTVGQADGVRPLPLQIGPAMVAVAPNGSIELRLEPADLGQVEIAFDFEADGLRATISSDRTSTSDLLRRHADQLLQHLRDAGFDGASLQFDERGREHRRRGAPPTATSGPVMPDAPGPPGAGTPAGEAGLDLRY